MINYSIRFPDDLYAVIKTLATENDRSVHGQVLSLVKRGLHADGHTVPPAERTTSKG